MIYDGVQDSLAYFLFSLFLSLLEFEHKNKDEDSLLSLTFISFRSELFFFHIIIHDSLLELILVILVMKIWNSISRKSHKASDEWQFHYFPFSSYWCCCCHHRTTHDIDCYYERRKNLITVWLFSILIFTIGLILINFYGRRIGNELLLRY